MSAKHLIQLRCDHIDGIYPRFRCFKTLTVREVTSFASARHRAKPDGWKHKDGKDFCPEHSA